MKIKPIDYLIYRIDIYENICKWKKYLNEREIKISFSISKEEDEIINSFKNDFFDISQKFINSLQSI